MFVKVKQKKKKKPLTFDLQYIIQKFYNGSCNVSQRFDWLVVLGLTPFKAEFQSLSAVSNRKRESKEN